MADFCLQCSLDMYFGPHSDFDHFGKDGAITEADVAEGKGILVLCEGCGPIHVDHRGRCISDDCLMGGHTTPGEREVLRRAERWVARRSGRLGWLYRLWDRWDGTPWDPGFRHELRFRWNDWRGRVWHSGDKPVEWEFEDFGKGLGDTGSDGAILRSGVDGNEGEGGPPVADLQPGEGEERLGPGEGPAGPVR